ncbi:MAG: hypothetical protein J6J86_03575, partial [Lachnospiraceae bacterium]|nr:hypothetical protein [Lachnospiraceae bacterium]
MDARKGRVGVSRGIITGVTNGSAGDGYSHWKLDETGWWLQYADGSYATGYTVSDVEGNVREIWAWEYINGAWWAFGADGYAHIGWLY